MKPRLVSSGADLQRVLVIDDTENPLTLADDRIEKAIRRKQCEAHGHRYAAGVSWGKCGYEQSQ